MLQGEERLWRVGAWGGRPLPPSLPRSARAGPGHQRRSGQDLLFPNKSHVGQLAQHDKLSLVTVPGMARPSGAAPALPRGCWSSHAWGPLRRRDSDTEAEPQGQRSPGSRPGPAELPWARRAPCGVPTAPWGFLAPGHLPKQPCWQGSAGSRPQARVPLGAWLCPQHHDHDSLAAGSGAGEAPLTALRCGSDTVPGAREQSVPAPGCRTAPCSLGALGSCLRQLEACWCCGRSRSQLHPCRPRNTPGISQPGRAAELNRGEVGAGCAPWGRPGPWASSRDKAKSPVGTQRGPARRLLQEGLWEQE